MKIEFEAKFLVDVKLIKKLLIQNAGKLQRKNRLMRRYIFVIPDKSDQWLRIRDEGDCVTMSVKSFDGRQSIDSVRELEIKVSDFDDACEIAKKLGCIPSVYCETYREVWKIGNCYIMIDHWPGLEPFIEIESVSKDIVESVAILLGLLMDDAIYGPVAVMYERELGISGKEFRSLREITFESIDEQLESARNSCC